MRDKGIGERGATSKATGARQACGGQAGTRQVGGGQAGMAGAPVRSIYATGTPRRGTDAAQFMPFAALTGYYGLVREQEQQAEPRRTLTEERVEDVSRMLARVRKGDAVAVVHYGHDAYVTSVGVVRQVDEAFRALDLASGQRILFEDIWELRWAEVG